MIKKDYMKPSMMVVQLQHRQHVLAGSGPDTLEGTPGEKPEDDIWYDLE